MRSFDGAASGVAVGPCEISDVVESALALLDMDAVYVSEFVGGRQVYRAAAGDSASFGIELGTGPMLAATYDQRMVNGELPSTIPDVAADDRVAHLESTRLRQIGAYVGVPIRRPDGSVFGAFCGLSHEPDPRLRDRDAKYLATMSRFLGRRLQDHVVKAEATARIRGVLDAEDQLLIALQPVIELASGRLSAVEALCRFPGLPGPPDVVFAEAGSVGLGRDLQFAAIDRALALVPDLPADCRLAINLSPEFITDADLAVRLSASSVPLERLTLEVTEHAAIHNYEDIAAVLAPLRADGLTLAVDDAGAGFASFTHVLRLQPDIVKIDQSLLRGLGSEESAPRAFFCALAKVAAAIDASVTAEGVETPNELAQLRALGVTHAQGYLLGRPTIEPSAWQTWREESTWPGERMGRYSERRSRARRSRRSSSRLE